jgi:hypothetical protein
LADEDGILLAVNDDSNSTLQSTLSLSSLDPGTYFLGISSFANFPIGGVGSPLTDFPNNGGSSGSYSIELTGVQSAPATYTLGSSPEGLPSGTSISFGNDLIAVVQGVSPEELSLNSSNFDFV